jgi:catechol-2,3-dioxygenase
MGYRTASDRTHNGLLFNFGLEVGDSDDELRAVAATPRATGEPTTAITDHTVTHRIYVTDPDGDEIELYVDVQASMVNCSPIEQL